ncbi:MAG: class I tRNA ligase family protein [Candidatus Absconditabacterales bacterium]|nr:class I tRNA ligase family protein [Candidatus Absconditabacterales bacterium]
MSQKELINELNQYRKEHKIFEKSIQERSKTLEAITYDGPPFASGEPHFGHGLVGTMKDLVGRYKTMKGYRVIRDRGRDCHGLPVEKAVEKKLGLDGKKDIEEKLGIEKFTQECRNYVSNVSDEWSKFVDQIGRWADMENAYMTMNLDFMESVINVFDNLYSKNLVYKGFNIQRYCPSCATALSNSEVNEGYEDKQDPAITIKFPLYNKNQEQLDKYEHSSDGSINVVCCVIKRDDKFLIGYHKKGQKYVFPGGKIEKGDSIEKTVIKEIKEEIGVEVKSQKTIGEFKEILKGNIWNLIYVETEIEGEPQNMEPDKTTHFQRAEIIDFDNELKMAIKIENTIIDDVEEIINQFYDLYTYKNNFAGQVKADKDINILAWTTTPWTLPSNSFLAVGAQISYVLVFDKPSQEYYVIAEKLLSKYYKDKNEYLLINKFSGEDMIGIFYKPLFEYINQSDISDEYKKQYFQIIGGDYVSTEDGTGIVHIAPSFGQEDFEVVANIFPRENAKDWLFLPVNDYGEFTDEVDDYKGTVVYDANKDIVRRLKDEGKLVIQQSYTHSYPHCWRCHAPLISRAMDSWFIKEPELKKETVENAKNIGFVPETVKKRFIDTLESAPDWNLSRKRYRGSPIPIWQNEKNEEDRLSIGTLEELYQNTSTGSKNITKHIFVRHAESIGNKNRIIDSIGDLRLSELGEEQKFEIIKKVKKEIVGDDFVIILSPLYRTFDTAEPLLDEIYGTEEKKNIENNYKKSVEKYQKLYKEKEILDYTLNDNNQQLFEIGGNVFVDMRLHELAHISRNGKEFTGHITTKIPTNTTPNLGDESIDHMMQRTRQYVKDISEKFKTKTIITFSHGDPIVGLRNSFRNFDYLTQKDKYYPTNGDVLVHYRDNSKLGEIDLHRPYVDNYWFELNGNKYYRIPEVMDCWFESGSMPFGQVGYIRRKDGTTRSHKDLIYPADWIMEGLDQTRGRFRVMHVLGNAMMGKNSFDNVVINGLILAENGHKMSKSLKNYPDPEYLFFRYGTDAYRLYMLSSPSVRAEPMRFMEKGVDQIYKDFTTALSNAYKFFETYAKVDKFKSDNTNLYFMRHSNANGFKFEDTLTQEGREKMNSENFITQILRLELDKIYSSTAKRTMQTAEIIQKIYKERLDKDIEIVKEDKLWQDNKDQIENTYQEILEKEKGKNILIVSHEVVFEPLRQSLYGEKASLSKAEIVKLPNYKISNDLDKWILASLHELGLEVEEQMNKYYLDSASKLILGFVDKLTNWYIRRSRRRFWASGMGQDKISGYNTFFEILSSFVKISAPFTPFISEKIYLQLQEFTSEGKKEGDSVHLKHFPLTSQRYVDKKLLSEIELVRKIISLGLFIRSKNNIKIKQPLAKMKIKID